MASTVLIYPKARKGQLPQRPKPHVERHIALAPSDVMVRRDSITLAPRWATPASHHPGRLPTPTQPVVSRGGRQATIPLSNQRHPVLQAPAGPANSPTDRSPNQLPIDSPPTTPTVR